MPEQHRFKVGELVRFAPGHRTAGTQHSGVFVVVRIMPEQPSGEWFYRIKGGDDRHEHAVAESQIVSADDP